MSRLDVVVLVLAPGTPNHDAAIADPAGFVEANDAALHRVAAEKMHERRILPLARGSAWAVIMPGDGVDAAVREMYGNDLADTVAKSVAGNPDSVLLWKVVECVPKGQG